VTRILRASDRDWQPWANGGGVSAVLFESLEGGAPRVRIALAAIDRDGPFSDYSGFERTLLHAGGPPLVLVVDGVRHTLSRADQLVFDGGAPVEALDVRGPVSALNLMLRHDSTGTIVVRDGTDLDLVAGAGTTLALLLSGAPTVAGRPLAPLDAVLLEPGAPVRFVGRATVAVVHVLPG
jgi:environmental stress-induced protein Ves